MVRPRKKAAHVDPAPAIGADADDGLDVNAVVSYNIKAIRERRGMTQQQVAEHLARLTKHLLPQASISAMERGFDGDRRRRFDAHELYLLATVFNVPIVYFFLPPPDTGLKVLADTHRPISELYASLLGHDSQLEPVDDRLRDINISNPDESDRVLAAIFGAEGAARNWHESFRTWRKKRINAVAREYGDRLDEVALFLAEFAEKITMLGPRMYLQSHAHRRGESVSVALHDVEDDDDKDEE
jgi:transcriptional regulator with XRE-family HTH domain